MKIFEQITKKLTGFGQAIIKWRGLKSVFRFVIILITVCIFSKGEAYNPSIQKSVSFFKLNTQSYNSSDTKLNDDRERQSPIFLGINSGIAPIFPRFHEDELDYRTLQGQNIFEYFFLSSTREDIESQFRTCNAGYKKIEILSNEKRKLELSLFTKNKFSEQVEVSAISGAHNSNLVKPR